MHAKHSRRRPIMEGLVLGLRVVFKIHKLIDCYAPYGPSLLSSGSFQSSLPSYRTVYVPITRETASAVHQGCSWRYFLVIGGREAESAF